MLNKKIFTEGFEGLCEVYERKPTEILTAMYYTVLQHMSNEGFNNAVNRILSTRSYNSLPKPAEFLTITEERQDKALLAFAEVLEKIQRLGSNKTVTFNDPLTMTILNKFFGGWKGVCKVTEENVTWLEKDFTEKYKHIALHEKYVQIEYSTKKVTYK